MDLADNSNHDRGTKYGCYAPVLNIQKIFNAIFNTFQYLESLHRVQLQCRMQIYMIYQSHYNLNANIYQQSYSHHDAECLHALEEIPIALFTEVFTNYRS